MLSSPSTPEVPTTPRIRTAESLHDPAQPASAKSPLSEKITSRVRASPLVGVKTTSNSARAPGGMKNGVGPNGSVISVIANSDASGPSRLALLMSSGRVPVE
jgi:hypothetical protein